MIKTFNKKHLPSPVFENIPSRRRLDFQVARHKAGLYSPSGFAEYYASEYRLRTPEDSVLHPDWQPFWLQVLLPKNQMTERQCFLLTRIHDS